MANILFKFNQWPSNQSLEEYKTKYEPFWIQNCVVKDEATAILTELSTIEDRVDISCVEDEEEYNGNPLYREKVDVKLCSFIESFLCNERGEIHWLEDTGLRVYLSQCCIYAKDDNDVEIPSAFDCITVPPLVSIDDITKINMWINIQKATSTLHYDAYHNLLCIYKGSKDVLLISPCHSHLLAPLVASAQSPNHSSLTTTTILQLIGNQITHSYYRQTISAGDCLFIPEGWWHLVISNTCTLAANFWFESSLQLLLKNAPHMVSHVLRSAFHELVDQEVSGENNQYTMGSTLGDVLLPAAKRIKTTTLDELYTDSLTQEKFNNFMNQLFEDMVRAADKSSSHSSNSDKINDGLSIDSRCMQLVSTEIGAMIQFWLPYSSQFPSQWTTLFLSLGPEAMHCLTHYWDSLEHLPLHHSRIVGGVVTQEMIAQFYVDVFAPCGDKVTEVRRHMIEQTDVWNSRHNQRLIDRLLLGKH